MKDFLENLISKKNAEIEELRNKIKSSDSADEVRSLGATLDAIMTELNEAKEQLAKLDEEGDDEEPADENEENMASASEATNEEEARMANFNPSQMAVVTSTEAEARNEAPRSSMEYRKAFMDYVQRGVMSDVLETRADASTNASNLGVLIPETIVQEIIKGVEKVYGQLYSRVKKTNIKGGVKYPIGSFSATFHRIGENGKSDRQSAGAVTTYVEFTYNIGEIRIARSLLESVLTVPVFEAEVAKVIIEAYVKAMDTEIMTGDSSQSECEGILTEAAKPNSRIPAGNIISISENDMKDWKTWQKKLFAKIPLSMRGLNPEFVMNASTYEANIKCLVDDNNRPVYNETYNPVDGAEISKFKGKNVVFVEDDIFAAFDDASTGDYFGMYWVPEKAYAINSNLEFTMRRYFDEELNQFVDKALVINDGKILDPKYLYLLKKVASV